MMVWEYATAVACAQLGVNPFDQPNVESAKAAARELLDSTAAEARPEIAFDGLSLYATPPFPKAQKLSDLPQLLGALAGARGYIALCVFAPRSSDEEWRECAHHLEETTGRPVTLGFGPRFLHSTGQFHKGGTPEGVFLQIIATSDTTVDIPGRNFDFWELVQSQAHGDARVLVATGQPVISLTGSYADVDRLRVALSS
jgi:glucose-6-phosphate isomerase